MQLRSHCRNRHEVVQPPENENLLNHTITSTTTTTMNTTIHNNITNSTISNNTNVLVEVVVSNDVMTTDHTNQHHRRRRHRNDRRSQSTTNEVVVSNTIPPSAALPLLHPQPIPILPSISSSSASSSTMSNSSTTSSNSDSGSDSILLEQTPPVQPRHRGQRSGLTSNSNVSTSVTSSTSSSHTAAATTDALVEHPVIASIGTETNTTNEVPPVEPISSIPHHNVTTTTTAVSSSSSSSTVVSSQPLPPTSPPRSAPTVTYNDQDTRPDGSTSGSDHGTNQYSSHTSPLPTLMGRHHQLDATNNNNNNSHIRSPLLEHPHSEQHHDQSRLNFHRHHRRRSCSTLSPPPPPQSRRASLTLASFHGHNNHNSDGTATTNHNNGNNSNTGTRRRNSVAPSSINNRNDVDGQYPSFEYRSSILQHHRRFPSSQVNNTSTTAASQSFDGFPLLPIPSLQPSEVPLPIHANRSATVPTSVTNDTTMPSTVNSATNGTTTIPYPIVLPPLPFFTAGTSMGTSSNVTSRQTDSTTVDETISTSTTQPTPRRSSARIAAVEAQKKQQQEKVVNETLDRRKAPPSSRNSSKKRPPPKPNDDKDIFIVEDDCVDDDEKKCKAREMCCICMSYPDDDNEPMATLSNCVHEFCTHCIMKWADTENSCPLCKQRFTSIVIHRKSHNHCSNHHIPNETSNRNKRAKTTNRNRRENGTKKSSKPYQKIVIQVPTRNQRSETGMVLETILQSLTTTNGIIAAAANFATDGGNVNINPFMSFNFGFRPNDNQNLYHDYITAARASFESGIRAGSTASTRQTQQQQQQQRGPQNPFVFAGATTLFPSMIRSQVAQDRTSSFSLPHSSNIGTNTDSTTGTATANSSQFHFHPVPQPSPNESLFANFLPTTMTRPMQVDTTSTTTASTSAPRSEQPQQHSPNHSLHIEENWGPYFLQVLGAGGGNGTAQSPTDSNSNSTRNRQNHPVNAPSQSMIRAMVAHHQMGLIPMGERLEHGPNTANDRYNQYLENIANSRTVNDVGNSSNINNSSNIDTTSRRENNNSNNEQQQHASYFLEMYPFTSAAHDYRNTNDSSLRSRLEGHRQQQLHRRQQLQHVGMNDVPREQQAQSSSIESMEASRRFLMDDYFEVQAHLSMMDNDNDVDGRRTQPAMATNGGHTVETAIEITEEEDDMDDDDDVIVLS